MTVFLTLLASYCNVFVLCPPRLQTRNMNVSVPFSSQVSPIHFDLQSAESWLLQRKPYSMMKESRYSACIHLRKDPPLQHNKAYQEQAYMNCLADCFVVAKVSDRILIDRFSKEFSRSKAILDLKSISCLNTLVQCRKTFNGFPS